MRTLDRSDEATQVETATQAEAAEQATEAKCKPSEVRRRRREGDMCKCRRRSGSASACAGKGEDGEDEMTDVAKMAGEIKELKELTAAPNPPAKEKCTKNADCPTGSQCELWPKRTCELCATTGAQCDGCATKGFCMPKACFDFPGWADSRGYGCAAYSECTRYDGGKARDGIDSHKACCKCGGGKVCAKHCKKGKCDEDGGCDDGECDAGYESTGTRRRALMKCKVLVCASNVFYAWMGMDYGCTVGNEVKSGYARDGETNCCKACNDATTSEATCKSWSCQQGYGWSQGKCQAK